MASAVELDPAFKLALKLLHSSNPESAEKIRISLDELIKQRHGSSKMLVNTLSKKHLAEESLSPGSGLAVRKHKPNQPKPVLPKDVAPESPIIVIPDVINISDTPIILSISDNEDMDDDDDVVVEEDHLKFSQELEDLMCIVCRRMDVSARNRLVECSECHSLYHQECHKPQIPEIDANDQEHSWFCTICKGKTPASKSSSSTASPPKSTSYSKHASSKNYESSSSSSSSSGKYKSSTSSKHTSSSSKTESRKVRENSTDSKEKEKEKDREKEKEKDRSKEKERDREKERDKERDRDKDRERDKERDREKEKDKEKVKSSNSSSSSSSSTITPNINIISADKRLQIMKKKAAKLQESKRKHK